MPTDAPPGGWPDKSPFVAAHFRCADERDDALFYQEPRLVTHIDEAAIAALRAHYARIFPARAAVLDLMSSHVSHFPAGFATSRAAGAGDERRRTGREPGADGVGRARPQRSIRRCPTTTPASTWQRSR